MSHSDTDGYRIINFRNFRIRIGCGYSKYLSDMDQELKNQYPLPSGGCAVLFAALCADLAGQAFGRIPVCDCYGLCNRP